jgi:predicted ATPase
MLTRLQISGFKNLVDVDVRFGPFTCVAGANGVGKSNLFDAVQFLSLLADRPLIEAALGVRGGRTAGVQSLFHRVGRHTDASMSFTAEMIVPREGQDDYGQEARATSTFLEYHLKLGYRADGGHGSVGALEILEERLGYIAKGKAHAHLLFPHSAKDWRSSVVDSSRSGPPFISTADVRGERMIQMHQDGGSRGQPLKYAAARLPRTVLSGSNAAESPTALLARREMQSWRLLQLEPSALRRPDPFTAPTRLGADGSHLAATLYRLAHQGVGLTAGGAEGVDSERVYTEVANRLAELYEDVQELWVDRDEKRELLTIHVLSRDRTDYPAPSLSDGSLRFLALAVLELDAEDRGLLCLEEPENGVQPERLPAMLRLLQDITTDVREPVADDNPLRQVIVNTHSPAVVQQVPEDSLLLALEREIVRDQGRIQGVSFKALPGTWRTKGEGAPKPVSLGALLSYLNPVVIDRMRLSGAAEGKRTAVIERPDIQSLMPQMSLWD